MKVKTAFYLFLFAIVIALFAYLYFHEEKKVNVAKAQVEKVIKEKEEALKQKEEEINALKKNHTKELGQAIALFVSPSLQARRTDLLTKALQGAIQALPLEEIVITDDKGKVLATTNLKYTNQTLEDEGIGKCLEEGKPWEGSGYVYVPSGKDGVVRLK